MSREYSPHEERLKSDRKIEPQPMQPGSYVAFNKLPDATWFEVVKVEGFALTVREAPGYAEQTIDLSLVAQRKDRTGHTV